MLDSLPDDVPANDQDAQLAPDLTEAIAALGEEDRNVVLLRLYYGFDTGETARLLGMTRDAVRGRLKRARKILREALGDGPRDRAAENSI